MQKSKERTNLPMFASYTTDRTLTYIPYMREKTVQERIIDSSDILIEDQYILEKEVEYIPICKHSVGSNIQYQPVVRETIHFPSYDKTNFTQTHEKIMPINSGSNINSNNNSNDSNMNEKRGTDIQYSQMTTNAVSQLVSQFSVTPNKQL